MNKPVSQMNLLIRCFKESPAVDHLILERRAGGIVLFILLALILFTTGCATSLIQGSPTAISILPLVDPDATIHTRTPDSSSHPQRLRITNQSDIPLYHLVVVFPDERIEFGDVPGRTTTEYQDTAQGVYRYAAYNVEVNGREYQQPVVDWVGEVPMQGDAFTYILEADPSRWATEGQVIRLIMTRKDL
jgi:hypothetical protein